MNILDFHLFTHALQQTQTLSPLVYHSCFHCLQCQHMFILIEGHHLWVLNLNNGFVKRVFIATCGTTPYNPKVNGQTKQYNGIKTAELVLKTIYRTSYQGLGNRPSWCSKFIRSLINTITNMKECLIINESQWLVILYLHGWVNLDWGWTFRSKPTICLYQVYTLMVDSQLYL